MHSFLCAMYPTGMYTLLTLWMVSSKLCCGPPFAWKCLSLSVVWFCTRTKDVGSSQAAEKGEYDINLKPQNSVCVQPKKSNFLLNKFHFFFFPRPLLPHWGHGIYRSCQGLFMMPVWVSSSRGLIWVMIPFARTGFHDDVWDNKFGYLDLIRLHANQRSSSSSSLSPTQHATNQLCNSLTQLINQSWITITISVPVASIIIATLPRTKSNVTSERLPICPSRSVCVGSSTTKTSSSQLSQ